MNDAITECFQETPSKCNQNSLCCFYFYFYRYHYFFFFFSLYLSLSLSLRLSLYAISWNAMRCECNWKSKNFKISLLSQETLETLRRLNNEEDNDDNNGDRPQKSQTTERLRQTDILTTIKFSTIVTAVRLLSPMVVMSVQNCAIKTIKQFETDLVFIL